MISVMLGTKVTVESLSESVVELTTISMVIVESPVLFPFSTMLTEVDSTFPGDVVTLVMDDSVALPIELVTAVTVSLTVVDSFTDSTRDDSIKPKEVK